MTCQEFYLARYSLLLGGQLVKDSRAGQLISIMLLNANCEKIKHAVLCWVEVGLLSLQLTPTRPFNSVFDIR